MDEAGIRVVGGDPAEVSRVVALLEFVGERVDARGPDALVLTDADGAWPPLPEGTETAILAGPGEPPRGLHVVARISEPFRLAAVMNALARLHAHRRDRRYGGDGGCAAFRDVVGVSDVMAQVRILMGKVAGNDTTVLITGESGTGKEVVARAIHSASPRRHGPFVPVNCGAIPADLLESELFGYEKGAFTGAVSAKAGRFELAAGGTLFLDEIGDMPLPMQIKVLRAIQERSFERVGGVQTIKADVRIVAATHRDLDAMMAAGTFREDLFYRLNVFPVALPPLRERAQDLDVLVHAIAAGIENEQGLRVRLTEDVVGALARYPWPGNVRELKNTLERLAVEFPDEVVTCRDLPRKFQDCTAAGDNGPGAPASNGTAARGAPGAEVTARLPVNGLDLKDYLARLERSLIEQALEDTNSVVARAADRLHIRRTTLVEKMRKYGIERA